MGRTVLHNDSSGSAAADSSVSLSHKSFRIRDKYQPINKLPLNKEKLNIGINFKTNTDNKNPAASLTMSTNNPEMIHDARPVSNPDGSPDTGTVLRPRITSFDGRVTTSQSDDVFHAAGMPPGAIVGMPARNTVVTPPFLKSRATHFNGHQASAKSASSSTSSGSSTNSVKRRSPHVRSPYAVRVNGDGSPILPGADTSGDIDLNPEQPKLLPLESMTILNLGVGVQGLKIDNEATKGKSANGLESMEFIEPTLLKDKASASQSQPEKSDEFGISHIPGYVDLDLNALRNRAVTNPAFGCAVSGSPQVPNANARFMSEVRTRVQQMVETVSDISKQAAKRTDVENVVERVTVLEGHATVNNAVFAKVDCIVDALSATLHQMEARCQDLSEGVVRSFNSMGEVKVMLRGEEEDEDEEHLEVKEVLGKYLKEVSKNYQLEGQVRALVERLNASITVQGQHIDGLNTLKETNARLVQQVEFYQNRDGSLAQLTNGLNQVVWPQGDGVVGKAVEGNSSGPKKVDSEEKTGAEGKSGSKDKAPAVAAQQPRPKKKGPRRPSPGFCPFM